MAIVLNFLPISEIGYSNFLFFLENWIIKLKCKFKKFFTSNYSSFWLLFRSRAEPTVCVAPHHLTRSMELSSFCPIFAMLTSLKYLQLVLILFVKGFLWTTRVENEYGIVWRFNLIHPTLESQKLPGIGAISRCCINIHCVSEAPFKWLDFHVFVIALHKARFSVSSIKTDR